MITLTPYEEAILCIQYGKYCAQFHRWHREDEKILSFDDWWREKADQANED